MWKNPQLYIKTKVYNVGVLSTLLYGSEYWTTYAAQERILNFFHMCALRKLFGISWMNTTPNTVVLSRCGLPTLFKILCQRRLRWMGHIRRMKDGWIPKDIMYKELITGKRNLGRPNYAIDMCTSGTWRNWILTWINGRTCHWSFQKEKLLASYFKS